MCQPGNVWFRSFTSVGEEALMSCRNKSLGVYLGSCPEPDRITYFAAKCDRHVMLALTTVFTT